MFTSFTSVGLGDFHPLNDLERLMCSFFLMVGVLLVSIVMSLLIKIFETYFKYSEEPNEDEKLTVFLSTIKKFN